VEGPPLKKLWRLNVLPEKTARWLAWAAGFVLLAGCTTLVLLMLPQLGLAVGVGLVSATALAWVIVGSLLPKLVRG
jgi:hypothetical protein